MRKIFLFIALINVCFGTTFESNLRNMAKSTGTKSIPKEFDEIKKIVDSKINPMTNEKITLGKELFFDKNLSKNKDISCASCHDIYNGGDDDKPTAVGTDKLKNPSHLNTPTVLNSAFSKFFFWNGRVKTLAEQAKGPIQAHFEMASTPELVVSRLKNNSKYISLFGKAFGQNQITFDNVANAIEIYEKTLIKRASFDDFIDGNDTAISKNAKLGLELFINIGCKGCHNSYAFGGENIKRFPLRDNNGLFVPVFRYSKLKARTLESIGFNFSPIYKPFPFENIGGFMGKNSTREFRVPILRNITKTAPYFHNGSIKTLEETIKIMGKYQVGIDLTEEQILQIKAFLESLESL